MSGETQTLDPPTGAEPDPAVPGKPTEPPGRSRSLVAPLIEHCFGDAEPGPAPLPPPPLPIPIPDGDPAAGALALLSACRPDAAAVLRSRIDAIGAELADQVEAARLDTAITLPRFLALAGRRVRLRQALQARAGSPSARSAAAEVLELVQSVRRWKPAEDLKAERARVLATIGAELEQVEGRLAALCSSFAGGNVLTVPGEGEHHRGIGLVHQHDEFLRRVAELLKTRATLKARSARLDAWGDQGRAAAVRDAIDRTGGVDALVGALAPSQASPAAEEAGRVRRAAADIGRQLDGIDPETRRAGELAGRKQTLEARLPELEARGGKQRVSSAAGIVSQARTGRLSAVLAMEEAVRGIRPELAEACASIRAGESDLVATIAEMIGE